MNQEQFTEILKNHIDHIEATLGRKADEYARGDRLSNFKDAAALMGCTPERALFGFVSKHIIALSDFIKDLEDGKMRHRSQWDEKIGDIACYMPLLTALLVERLREEKVVE